MATFHPFPRLPYELRAMVWALAAEPRTVQINIDYGEGINPQVRQSDFTKGVCYLVSSTPLPAVLHTCRESRKQSPYEKLFYCQETEPCYVWVNFDLDMFDIGIGDVYFLFHNRSRVRRLKLDIQYDCWAPEDFEDWQFENLVEFHVVVHDLREFATFWDVDFLPFKQGNFVLIDGKTGKMMNSCDLDDMLRRLLIITRLYLGYDHETDGEEPASLPV